MRALFSWLEYIKNPPYRFLIAAGVIAALLCLFPVRADAPQEEIAASTPPPQTGVAAGADLSARTDATAWLHKTLVYAPCGHSIQRRERMPAQLCGLSRSAFEPALHRIIANSTVTSFSSAEVDISVSMDVPCPLHWVLRGGGDGMLHVMQNRSGDALETVRDTDVPTASAPPEDRLLEGMIFDDVQALEGYLESLSS